MAENEINEINFTKKCILMSVISQDKNVTLVNPFTKIPIAKIYTANSSCETFVYSKIKGALCLFMNKDPKKRIYYFRIYELKTYSLVFNMELKKEYIQYITYYQDDFYFMELYDSFLGFKFLSKESGRIFFQLLNEDPNKDIIEQNEYAQEIDPHDISSTLPEIISFIKEKLESQYGNSSGVSKTGGYRRGVANRRENYKFKNMIIDDKKGEYLDLSILEKIFLVVNNLECDDQEQKLNIFTDTSFNIKDCQKLIKKYDNIKHGQQLNIIDKDCKNIINKNLYVTILSNNIMNNIRLIKRLKIFKKEYRKRMRMQKENTTGKLLKITNRKSRLTQIGRSRIATTASASTMSSISQGSLNDRLSYSNNINKDNFKFKGNVVSEKNEDKNIKKQEIKKTNVVKEKDDKKDYDEKKEAIGKYFTESNVRSNRSNTTLNNNQVQPKHEEKKKSFFGNMFGKNEKMQEIPEVEEKSSKFTLKRKDGLTIESKGVVNPRKREDGKSSMSNILNNKGNNANNVITGSKSSSNFGKKKKKK